MLFPLQNDVRNRLDLSGIWDFRIDPDSIGERDGWFNGLHDARPLAVPGSWNDQYADLFNYLDLAWYVTRATIPQDWRTQRVFIRVGSANYFATVYINGTKVGSHEGGHLPFAFEITDLIVWDAENLIAISVENTLKPTRVPSGDVPSPLGFSGFPRTTFDFFPFAGLHRPVLLYSVPQAHIDDITVETTIEGADGIVQVTVHLSTPVNVLGAATLTGGAQTIQSALSFEAGIGKATLVVPSARLWSDKTPYLYELTLTADSDRYALRIGIRTVQVREG